MTFAFDEQFAMFDITPVENQFILEYMPGAKGEYVKVYLYGLLCCYHPRKEMDMESMCRELGLTEDQIMQAFRYWERRRIVRRIQDHPPVWQYINIKQLNLTSIDAPEPDYVQFCREIENCFEGRREFHGSEMAECYEWKEQLHLSQEAVLMLLKHMERTRGKNFRIRDAGIVAEMLSREKAFTAEDAEHLLARDEMMNAGFREVLRKMGKRYNPSDANLALYKKWRQEWNFTQEAVLDACDRTGTADPNLAVVDAILEQTFRSRGGNNQQLNRSDLDAYEADRKNLKKVLSEIGQRSIATPSQQKTYDEIRKLFPNDIVLIAAKECAAKKQPLESVLKLLKSWQDRGFTSEQEIREHVSAFHEKEEYMRFLRQKWSSVQGTDTSQKAIQMLEKWEGELGFSREMITLAAELAFESRKPLSYMDKVLSEWAEKGIRTTEEAEKEKKERQEKASAGGRKNSVKAVAAQQYVQRDYAGEQEEAMQRMLSEYGGQENA